MRLTPMDELSSCRDVHKLYLGGWIANKRNQVELFAESQQGSQNPFSHPAFVSLWKILILILRYIFSRAQRVPSDKVFLVYQ
jgi:hypothetical protein